MKIINRLLLSLLCTVFLIMFSSLTQARIYGPPSNANLEILSAEISPQPARPGQDMFIKINIENYGQSPAEDVVVELEENFPFHFKYSNAEYGVSKHYTNTSITISKISAYSSYEVFYYFTVDSLAKTGEYDLSFKISSTKGGTVGSIRDIIINVEGKPDISITDFSLSPEVISPGDEFTLETNVTSVGTGNAKNIRVNLILDDLPEIVPLDGSGKFIQELESGTAKIVSFRLKLSKDADPSSYNIPIQLSGIDETENISITQTETIGIDAHGNAKLSIANVKPDPLKIIQGNDFALMIKIENSGKGDAKSVKASIDAPLQGNKEAFLGKIEPDEDSPAIFVLHADKSGSFEYNLTIEYVDDYGVHTTQEELKLIIYPKSQGSTGLIIIAIIVLVGLGAYWFFVRIKKEE